MITYMEGPSSSPPVHHVRGRILLSRPLGLGMSVSENVGSASPRHCDRANPQSPLVWPTTSLDLAAETFRLRDAVDGGEIVRWNASRSALLLYERTGSRQSWRSVTLEVVVRADGGGSPTRRK